MKIQYEDAFRELKRFFKEDFGLEDKNASIMWKLSMDNQELRAFPTGRVDKKQEYYWKQFFNTPCNASLKNVFLCHKHGLFSWDFLPEEIQNVMLDYQEQSSGYRDEDDFKKNIASGFTWSETEEGNDFWHETVSGNWLRAMEKFVNPQEDMVIDKSKLIIL